MRQLTSSIFTIFIVLVLVILATPNVSAEKNLSQAEIQQFLEGAFEAQLVLNEKGRTIEEVMEILSPYFTEEYSRLFIEARLFKDIDGWYLPGSDDFFAIVPRFSFDESTEIRRTSNTILIEEFVEANTEGPWTWNAHVESVELEYGKDGYRISNVNELLSPKSNVAKSEGTTSTGPVFENHPPQILALFGEVLHQLGAKVFWILQALLWK